MAPKRRTKKLIKKPVQFLFLKKWVISPTTPRRKAKTQMTKINPVAMVLQDPILAR
jgi:hypothetical protein